MAVGEPEALISGIALTVIVTVLVSVQPLVSPITVNVVVTLGLTITIGKGMLPGFQVKELAPLAFKVPELPKQIAVEVPAVETVGFELTVKPTVLVVVQPKAFVPDTVNIVETSGVLTNEEVLIPPGFQVKVKAPLADKVELPPGQIAVGDAAGFKIGALNVVIVAVALLVHVRLEAITV